MGIILTKAVTMILILALSYVLKRRGIMKKEYFPILSFMVMSITLPSAIVSNFSKITMEYSMFLIIIVAFLSNLVFSGTGYLMARRKSQTEKAFHFINMSGYNIGTFTMPFVQNFFSPIALVSTYLFDIGNAIMCVGGTYGVASAIADKKHKLHIPTILKRTFSSIPLCTYIVMTIIALTGLKLPALIISFADTASGANAFLAMFMLGLGFELNLNAERLKKAAGILIARFVLAGLLAFGCYQLMPFSLEIRQTLAIICLSPLASTGPVFTDRCGGDTELASVVNSLSIVISVVCMTSLILYFS